MRSKTFESGKAIIKKPCLYTDGAFNIVSRSAYFLA